MFLSIEIESERPIYEQLILQIKKGVLRGELALGEQLPSVRSLASDIGINMHTVNKAYKYLEEENVLIQLKKGFAVNPEFPLKQSEHSQQRILDLLEEVMIDAALYDYSQDELLVWMQKWADDLQENGKGSC